MRSAILLLVWLGIVGCSPAPEQRSVARRVELFDGKTLNGWRAIEFELGGGAEASVAEDGSLQIGMGKPMAGIVFDEPGVAMPVLARVGVDERGWSGCAGHGGHLEQVLSGPRVDDLFVLVPVAAAVDADAPPTLL